MKKPESVVQDRILNLVINEFQRAVVKHSKSNDLRDADEAVRCRWSILEYVDVLRKRDWEDAEEGHKE